MPDPQERLDRDGERPCGVPHAGAGPGEKTVTSGPRGLYGARTNVAMEFNQLLAPGTACLTLAALLWLGEWRDSRRARWLLKPLTSALFLLAAVAHGPHSRYDWLIVAGLMLSVTGDICLIPIRRQWFLLGLVAFLVAHLCYLAAFGQRVSPLTLNPLVGAVIVGMSIALFLYFRPHLGPMRWPVLVYVIVITLMLMGAWSLVGRGSEWDWRVAAGATLFYLSDITVARARFIADAGYANRAAGLSLYYAAQFLLALSVGA
jgi:uncharacterized membrane protein YhhN